MPYSTGKKSAATSILVALLTFAASALAAPPSLGASITPFTGGIPALTVSGFLPLTVVDTDEGIVTVSGRADLTAAFDVSVVPSVGVAASASLGAGEIVDPYIGTGAALGWRDLDGERAAFLTWTLHGGVRYPIDDMWSARVEAISAPLLGGFALSFGVDVTPWK